MSTTPLKVAYVPLHKALRWPAPPGQLPNLGASHKECIMHRSTGPTRTGYRKQVSALYRLLGVKRSLFHNTSIILQFREATGKPFYVFSTSRPEPLSGSHPIVGTRFESVYALNAFGNVRLLRGWRYADRQNLNEGSTQFTDEARSLVIWETQLDWYDPLTPDTTRLQMNILGKRIRRDLYFTVYEAPDKRFGLYLKRRLVNESMAAVLQEQALVPYPLEMATDRLAQLARTFEYRMYNRGFREAIERSVDQSVGSLGCLGILSWRMDGRLMVTFQGNRTDGSIARDSFTLIGDEPPNTARFTWRSVNGSLDRASELIASALRTWDYFPHDMRGELLHKAPQMRMLATDLEYDRTETIVLTHEQLRKQA